MGSIRNWTIKKQLFVVLGVCVVVIAALVGLGAVQSSRLRTIQDQGAQRSKDALTVEEAGGMGARIYQVIADTELNLNFTESRKAWADVKRESIADFEACAKIADTPNETAFVRDAQASFNKLVELFENRMLPALEKTKDSTAESLKLDGEIDAQVQAMSKPLDEFVKSIAADADAGDQAFDAAASTFSTISWIVGIVGFSLAVAFGGFLSANINNRLRQVSGELRSGASQVVSAASQVSASAQSLSQGSSEQAASLEETSASMEEMASMTRQTDQNTQQAASLMAKTAEQVERANRALAEMESSMAGIKDSSAKVSKIIKTIDEIAFQTNILALNAAVEAARAGEAGMGFAVVADEVRNLAQRAGQAAKDTAALIEESLERSQSGETKVVQMGEAISAITDSAQTVKRLIDEVSGAARQQTQGIDQVSQALSEMEKVTQGTAATAEEAAAASEELNAQAEASMALVDQLEALVGGKVGFAPAGGHQAAPRGAAKAAPKILKMTSAKARRSAEDAIPLQGDGTFGSF
jgi:methyl-accepting chemotaxis protein